MARTFFCVPFCVLNDRGPVVEVVPRRQGRFWFFFPSAASRLLLAGWSRKGIQTPPVSSWPCEGLLFKLVPRFRVIPPVLDPLLVFFPSRFGKQVEFLFFLSTSILNFLVSALRSSVACQSGILSSSFLMSCLSFPRRGCPA